MREETRCRHYMGYYFLLAATFFLCIIPQTEYLHLKKKGPSCSLMGIDLNLVVRQACALSIEWLLPERYIEREVIYTYIHTYIHTFIHICMHADIQIELQAKIRQVSVTDIQTCRKMCRHTDSQKQ